MYTMSMRNHVLIISLSAATLIVLILDRLKTSFIHYCAKKKEKQ